MKKTSLEGQSPAKPRMEKLRLAGLIPHPDQEKYFRRYGEFEYAALKADIEARGLMSPIEVLPPGNTAGLPAHTVLVGHTRRKILLELGESATEALVRYDLIRASRADVDKCFLLDNVARRQQDRLGQARAAVRLFQIEREQKGKSALGDPLQNGELRDRIGGIVGMSGRNLQRYFNVLAAPVEVQDAFQAGRVKLVDAARVIGLTKGNRERLAARLGSNEDPKAVLTAFFPPKVRGHVHVNDAVASFARSLEAASADLADRLEGLTAGPVRKNEKQLRRGSKLIKKLLRKLDPVD